ncbi:MAG: helix-turn-helix domain-containing protein [Pseudomonadota bacterium]
MKTREQRIGITLRRRRMAHNLSIADVEAKWQIPAETIRSIEGGNIDHQFVVVSAYASALDVELLTLFTDPQREFHDAVTELRISNSKKK